MTDSIDRDIGTGMPAAEGDARQASEAASMGIGTETENESSVHRELEAARQEAAANQDRYLRARADMENYKKRIERTYSDLARSGKKDLLLKLLGVKDNLERALQYGVGNAGGGESVLEGVRLTQYQLEQVLQQEGVKVMESEGKPFDPRLEEAIQSVNDPSVPDHTVVQVVRSGYNYEDEVLRPAQVIVSVHPDNT